uniref:uncharacterized protein LOC105349888 n=1 Tax=Fragaria vesca subsp. vesca TaxID=101020 RepID=UPI0005C9CCA4|nr:PREDICTED: uncharacterized protein LOC105349888 [Fragaria vesca subsp. vesca]
MAPTYRTLVNLMSNTQIRIIPLGLCWFDIKNIKKLFVLERRPTSSSESIYNTNFDLIMLAPVSAQLNIVLCTNNKFHRLGFMGYNDILLYKGELYALRIIRGTCFGIHVFDQEQIYRIYLIRGIAPNSNKDEVYLVESGGDLFLVRRQPNDLLQTAGFDVFKLTTDEYECWYLNAVKLQSLGNHQALFWGRQGCFSVPVEESSPFEEDHIYFIHVLEENRLTEYGVYSLKDGSIKQVPNLNVPGPPSASAESFWFFPTVKDTTVYPKRKLKVD